MVDLNTSVSDLDFVNAPIISPSSDGKAAMVAALGGIAQSGFESYLQGKDKRSLNELSTALTSTDHLTNAFSEGLARDNFSPLTPEELKDITQTQALLNRHALKQRQRGTRGVGVDTRVNVLNDFKRRNPRLALDADSVFSSATGRSPGAAITELENDPLAEEISDIELAIANENQGIIDSQFQITGDYITDVEKAREALGKHYATLYKYQMEELKLKDAPEYLRKAGHTQNIVANLLPEEYKSMKQAIDSVVNQVTKGVDAEGNPKFWSAEARESMADITIETAWTDFQRRMNFLNIGGDDTAMQRQLDSFKPMVDTLKKVVKGDFTKDSLQRELDILDTQLNHEISFAINPATNEPFLRSQKTRAIAEELLSFEDKAGLSPVRLTLEDSYEVGTIAQMTDKQYRSYTDRTINTVEDAETLYLNMVESLGRMLTTAGQGPWNEENLLTLADRTVEMLKGEEATDLMMTSTMKLLARPDTFDALQQHAPILMRQMQPVLDRYAKAAAIRFSEDVGEALSSGLTESVLFMDFELGPVIEPYLTPKIIKVGDKFLVDFQVVDTDKLKDDIKKHANVSTTNRRVFGTPYPQQFIDKAYDRYVKELDSLAKDFNSRYRERFQDFFDARMHISPERDPNDVLEDILSGKGLFEQTRVTRQEVKE